METKARNVFVFVTIITVSTIFSLSHGLIIVRYKNESNEIPLELGLSMDAGISDNSVDYQELQRKNHNVADGDDDVLTVDLETIQRYYSGLPLRRLTRTKRVKRQGELEDDSDKPADASEIKAAEQAAVSNSGSGGGAAEYPKETTPNVTCMTIDDMNARRQMMTGSYGKSRKRCPKKFPCRDFQSCRIWRTGFVDKNMVMDLKAANSYYGDLFVWMHKTKLESITQQFQECVTEYKLSEEFKDPKVEKEKGEDKAVEKEAERKGRRKRRKRETLDEHEKMKNANAGNVKPEEEQKDRHDRSIICLEKIEDFLECFDRAAVQGTCYWPDETSAEKPV